MSTAVPPDDGDEQDIMWQEFRHEIDLRLDARRPERAGVSEKEWREPVYGWARNHLPDELNIVRRIAEREVDLRERQATRRGNDYIRAWMHGRMPLSWQLVGPLPIKVGKLRIRLDIATASEVEDAARELRANAKAVYDEVLLLCDGLLDIGRQARQKGCVAVALIGDQPPRSEVA
jgi:hypothetical protein